jgi:hypothetical protein
LQDQMPRAQVPNEKREMKLLRGLAVLLHHLLLTDLSQYANHRHQIESCLGNPGFLDWFDGHHYLPLIYLSERDFVSPSDNTFIVISVFTVVIKNSILCTVHPLAILSNHEPTAISPRRHLDMRFTTIRHKLCICWLPLHDL